MSPIRSRTIRTHAQAGVAILAITVILLVVATIGTLAVGRVGLQEQRIVGADVRSKEVYAAAVGGLEYAVKWFEWVKESDVGGVIEAKPNYELLVFDEICPDGVTGMCAKLSTTLEVDEPDALEGGADIYTQDIVYELLSWDPNPITVRAHVEAKASGDTHILKRASIDLILGDLGGGPFPGGSPVFDGPPILVEECMGNNTGTPKVIVMDDGDNATAIPPGIITTNGTADDDCLDEGHVSQYVCPETGCEYKNNGTMANSVPEADSVVKGQLVNRAPLFETIFSYDPSEFTQLEFINHLAQLDPQRIAVIDSDADLDSFESIHGKTPGTEQSPVIMYFGSSYCPKLNGGWRIWGLVYISTLDPGCNSNGWGNTVIHGTLAKAGNLNKLTANIEIFNQGELRFDFGATIENDQIVPGMSELVVSVIPGSWRDF